jgi:hypothetical protein
MPLVFFLYLRIDKDIIKVYNIIFIKDALYYFINIGLEHCRHVIKAKKHNYIFIIAISHVKYYLLFITLLDPNMVVCILQV